MLSESTLTALLRLNVQWGVGDLLVILPLIQERRGEILNPCSINSDLYKNMAPGNIEDMELTVLVNSWI